MTNTFALVARWLILPLGFAVLNSCADPEPPEVSEKGEGEGSEQRPAQDTEKANGDQLNLDNEAVRKRGNERLKEERFAALKGALANIDKPDLMPTHARWTIGTFEDAKRSGLEDEMSEERLPMDKLVDLLLQALDYHEGPQTAPLSHSHMVPGHDDVGYVAFVGSRVTEENGEPFFNACEESSYIAKHILINHQEEFLRRLDLDPGNGTLAGAIRWGREKRKLSMPFFVTLMKSDKPGVQNIGVEHFSGKSAVPIELLPLVKRIYDDLPGDSRFKYRTRGVLQAAYLTRFEKQLESDEFDAGNRELITAMRDVFADRHFLQKNPLSTYLAGNPTIDSEWPSVLEELDFIVEGYQEDKGWLAEAYAKLGGVEKGAAYALDLANAAQNHFQKQAAGEVSGTVLFLLLKEDRKRGESFFEEIKKADKAEKVRLQVVLEHFRKRWDQELEALGKADVQALAVGDERTVFLVSELLIKGRFPSPVARTWTSSDGGSLTATFISATDSTVTLRRDTDDKEFDIPLARLSDADLAYIREQLNARPVK